VQWLRRLQVWDKVDAHRVNSIHRMRLWHEDANLQLDSMDAHLPDLGVIIEQQNLMQAFGECLKGTALQARYGAVCSGIENNGDGLVLKLQDGSNITAQLLLGADSARSWVRDALGISTRLHDFEQTAIVANFKTEKPHQNAAYQWFRPHETLALLPMSNQHASLVWAMSTQLAQQKLMESTEALAAEVGDATGHLLGVLAPVTSAAGFPLKQITASRFVAERAVLLGDAAHQVHPMAGQGVNLGFRDVVELTRQIQQAHAMMPIGDAQLLRRYERARKADVMGMNLLTGGLDALFASNYASVQKLADWGFRQAGQQGWLRKRLIQQAVI
jgi:ubiquinone biosynthesis UbiH/UbiF/VisC/COQ6 family hydroxylase